MGGGGTLGAVAVAVGGTVAAPVGIGVGVKVAVLGGVGVSVDVGEAVKVAVGVTVSVGAGVAVVVGGVVSSPSHALLELLSAQQGEPAVGQYHPLSVWQESLQPSPADAFPSSHCSIAEM